MKLKSIIAKKVRAGKEVIGNGKATTASEPEDDADRDLLETIRKSLNGVESRSRTPVTKHARRAGASENGRKQHAPARKRKTSGHKGPKTSQGEGKWSPSRAKPRKNREKNVR